MLIIVPFSFLISSSVCDFFYLSLCSSPPGSHTSIINSFSSFSHHYHHLHFSLSCFSHHRHHLFSLFSGSPPTLLISTLHHIHTQHDITSFYHNLCTNGVDFDLSLPNLRKLVILTLDRVKRGRGPVVVKTVGGIVFVVLWSSVYSVVKMRNCTIEAPIKFSCPSLCLKPLLWNTITIVIILISSFLDDINTSVLLLAVAVAVSLSSCCCCYHCLERYLHHQFFLQQHRGHP